MNKSVTLDVKSLLIIGLSILVMILAWNLYITTNQAVIAQPTKQSAPYSPKAQTDQSCITYDGDYTNDEC